MNELLTPEPTPCWCDPSHPAAAFVVDLRCICSSCADGIARAVPIDPAQRRPTVSASLAATAVPAPASVVTAESCPSVTANAAAPEAPSGDADAQQRLEQARAERDRR